MYVLKKKAKKWGNFFLWKSIFNFNNSLENPPPSHQILNCSFQEMDIENKKEIHFLSFLFKGHFSCILTSYIVIQRILNWNPLTESRH